jgi:hypothetical protein
MRRTVLNQFALTGTAIDYCVEPPGLTTQTVMASASATDGLDLASFDGFASTPVLTMEPYRTNTCSIFIGNWTGSLLRSSVGTARGSYTFTITATCGGTAEIFR